MGNDLETVADPAADQQAMLADVLENVREAHIERSSADRDVRRYEQLTNSRLYDLFYGKELIVTGSVNGEVAFNADGPIVKYTDSSFLHPKRVRVLHVELKETGASPYHSTVVFIQETDSTAGKIYRAQLSDRAESHMHTLKWQFAADET